MSDIGRCFRRSTSIVFARIPVTFTQALPPNVYCIVRAKKRHKKEDEGEATHFAFRLKPTFHQRTHQGRGDPPVAMSSSPRPTQNMCGGARRHDSRAGASTTCGGVSQAYTTPTTGFYHYFILIPGFAVQKVNHAGAEGPNVGGLKRLRCSPATPSQPLLATRQLTIGSPPGDSPAIHRQSKAEERRKNMKLQQHTSKQRTWEKVDDRRSKGPPERWYYSECEEEGKEGSRGTKKEEATLERRQKE